MEPVAHEKGGQKYYDLLPSFMKIRRTELSTNAGWDLQLPKTSMKMIDSKCIQGEFRNWKSN